LSGVAAALLAIGFLAFQLKLSWWTQPLRHYIAVFTLVEFGAPLVIGLAILMPSHPWRIAASVVGVASTALLFAYWISYARARRALKAIQQTPERFDRQHVRGSPITLACTATLVASSLLPERVGIYLVASICVWSLISGSFESWRLLAPDRLP
jgi:hypothetical protein